MASYCNPFPSHCQMSTSNFASRRGGEVVVKQWRAHVSCKEHQVGGSFSVFIFLGDVPPDPDRWLTDRALAGIFDVYTGIRDGGDDHVVTGLVLLNHWLSERSGLPSLDESVVVPFLKREINWAVRSALTGERVPLNKIASLQVTVLCMPLRYPIGAKHPIEGKPVFYHEITRGRPGGHPMAITGIKVPRLCNCICTKSIRNVTP